MSKPVISQASTQWQGDLLSGSGQTHLDTSGVATFEMAWGARSEGNEGTNPEELIAAAHATCFSMAFAHGLAQHGTTAQQINTRADVTFDAGIPAITGIRLTVEAQVPGISEADFHRIAEETKLGCPVSKALASVPITLTAHLIEGDSDDLRRRENRMIWEGGPVE